METLFILIPLGLVLVAIAISFFVWAVNKDQFNDLESPGEDIIFDDRQEREEHKPKKPDNSSHAVTRYD